MGKSPASFKQLQDEWYKKLKDEGFVDIESSLTLDDGQKGYETTGRVGPNLKNKTSEQFQATLLYYQNCRSFLTCYNFDCELDKTIWEMYSEGVPYRKISEELEKQNVKFKKDSIRKIIKRLEKVMNTEIFVQSIIDEAESYNDEI